MLPVICGHEKVDAKVIDAIWSVLDFAYMAQYSSLSESNLNKMKNLLSSFNWRSSSAMAHKNHAIFTSLNCMHCGTLWTTFTQEGLLTIAVLKHPSHYTLRCVRIHMELPIIMTMTNKSSTTLTYIQDHLSMHYAYED